MFDFAYAYEPPVVSGKLKQQPEDFIVEERLSYSLTGEGEHLWLWIEKTNQNSDWVAKELAKFIGIPARAVGVAGKKDRFAVTRQWMSCHLPGQADPDFSQLDIPGVQVLETLRHSRKLQTGGLAANRFQLVLRDLQGDLAGLENRLQLIKEQGVPNYFGEQRFGRNFDNLKQATRFFKGEIRPKRFQKTLYLSAARSWIFNEILSQRVADHSWNLMLEGEVLQLEGSQKWFVDDGDQALRQRVLEQDLHPTGALWGRGELPSSARALELEQQVTQQHPVWCSGLENAGMKQDRRALRVLVKDLEWSWLESQSLQLCFTLPAGSFATMLVRELLVENH